jgi:hypothetical protein
MGLPQRLQALTATIAEATPDAVTLTAKFVDRTQFGLS